MGFFANKIAIVTGGGSGIGRGLCEELSRRGAKVVAADRDADRIRETAESIAGGGLVEGVELDVTDYDGFKRLADDVVGRYGRIDYLFNNAGIGVGGEARHCTPDDWRKVLDVNLYGVIHGVSAVYPLMADQGFGHIINTASIEGLAPFPGTIGYVASKHAVVGLSTTLRVEGADLGVKVSVVCPGYVKTAIFQDSELIKMDRGKMMEGLTRLKGVTPSECAKIVLNGVRRNKAIIVVTGPARLLWIMSRISPNLTIWLMRMHCRKMREEVVMDE